jgi:hypothetical protein
MALYGYIWPFLLGGTAYGVASAADTYTRIYEVIRASDRAAGVQHDDPSVNQPLARAAGTAAGVLTFAGTYEGFRRIMQGILLAKRPDPKKLFDELGPADRPPRVTPPYLWRMLGPDATGASYSSFFRLHGMQSITVGMALMWAVAFAPFVHAKVEGMFAPVDKARAEAVKKAAKERLRQQRSGGG